MRVSSLSNERIQGLVSRYFVPAWISRDNYQLGETAREDALQYTPEAWTNAVSTALEAVSAGRAC